MENKEKILLASTCGLGAISIVFISLFAWKAATGGGGGGDDPGPTPSGETEIVEFFNEDGSLLKREKITKGDKVTKPEDPETEDGYFANWYTEPTFEHIYSFDTGVESDLKLYPKFAKHLLTLSYDYNTAHTTGGIETPTIEMAIDADPQEEVFINWGDSDEIEQITDFSEHISHPYIAAPASNLYDINIYGQPNAISLSSVTDETKPWETHLFKNDNAYAAVIELYQDFGDTTKSSSFGGLDSINEKSSLREVMIHDGVSYIPNHFLASTKFSTPRMLFEKMFFPDSVKHIGEYAYANTNLNEALFRDSVEYIHDGAFRNCTNIQYIRFGQYLKEVGAHVFDGPTTGISVSVEALSDAVRQNRTPEFGDFESLSFNIFYLYYKDSRDVTLKPLKDKGWPVDQGSLSTANICLQSTDLTEPSSKHVYKMINKKYPLYYESSSFVNDFYGEVVCLDDPSVDISKVGMQPNVVDLSYDYNYGVVSISVGNLNHCQQEIRNRGGITFNYSEGF